MSVQTISAEASYWAREIRDEKDHQAIDTMLRKRLREAADKLIVEIDWDSLEMTIWLEGPDYHVRYEVQAHDMDGDRDDR